jgi:DUF971 family protein
MSVQPVKIEPGPKQDIFIEWSDGVRLRYDLQELSDACPCANCRESRSARAPSPSSLNVVSADEPPPLKLRAITPVGNYAYKIEFDRGCNLGIYTVEFLRELGTATD